jgi:hypothetical protein
MQGAPLPYGSGLRAKRRSGLGVIQGANPR